jgi:AcrR family transcriptional regulator
LTLSERGPYGWRNMIRTKQAPSEQDTRERVIRAAADLFADRGYAGTSISAIREASGVLPSSIYWEFGNKEGVFAAVLEDSTERWLAGSTRAVARLMRQRASASGNILEPYFDFMAEALAARPEGLRLMLLVSVERRHGDSKPIEIIRAARRQAVEGLARVFAGAGLVAAEPESEEALDVARLIMMCFDGAVVAAQIDADAGDFKRMFRKLYSALRQGGGS